MQIRVVCSEALRSSLLFKFSCEEMDDSFGENDGYLPFRIGLAAVSTCRYLKER